MGEGNTSVVQVEGVAGKNPQQQEIHKQRTRAADVRASQLRWMAKLREGMTEAGGLGVVGCGMEDVRAHGWCLNVEIILLNLLLAKMEQD